MLASINGIIEENNYLFPLFELTKLLLLLTRYKISRIRNLEIDDEIAWLRRYESMFIGTDLEYFYRYLIIVGSDKKYQLEYDESSDIDDEYGLLFYAYMINSYFNEDYESVICYYIELEHPLLKYHNLKRYSYASIFYLSALNNLGRFKKCAAGTFEPTLVIYMLACLGLSQYEYVLDKYYELNSYRKKLLPHALIAARKLNKIYIYIII